MSGTSDQLGGRIKQAAGDLTDDKDLKAEGQVDESKGKLKDKLSGAVDSVADKLKGDKKD